jgi:hypothetical protein
MRIPLVSVEVDADPPLVTLKRRSTLADYSLLMPAGASKALVRDGDLSSAEEQPTKSAVRSCDRKESDRALGSCVKKFVW